MQSTLITPATEPPVTLAEVRHWLAFDSEIVEDDGLLLLLIDEITDFVEGTTGRALMPQTWELLFDKSEVTSVITIPKLPLLSVTSITVSDDAGDESVVDTSLYSYSTGQSSARIYLTPGSSWPTMREYDSFKITATFGYKNFPPRLQLLMKGLILHFYRTKGSGVLETVSGQLIGLPQQFRRMLTALSIPEFK